MRNFEQTQKWFGELQEARRQPWSDKFRSSMVEAWLMIDLGIWIINISWEIHGLVGMESRFRISMDLPTNLDSRDYEELLSGGNFSPRTVDQKKSTVATIAMSRRHAWTLTPFTSRHLRASTGMAGAGAGCWEGSWLQLVCQAQYQDGRSVAFFSKD